MVDCRHNAPRGAAGVDCIVFKDLTSCVLPSGIVELQLLLQGETGKLINRHRPLDQAQARFFHDCHAAIISPAKLNQAHRHQPVTSKRSSAFSSIVRPKPCLSSSRSMYPPLARGSPWKMYQNSSFPTSTSTGGKYSAIGEFTLDITT